MVNKFLSIALAIFVLIQLFSCKDDQSKKSSFRNYLKNTQWFVESEVLLHSDEEQVYLLSRRTDSATRFNFQAMDFLDLVHRLPGFLSLQKSWFLIFQK